jgi:hypothetical protein
MLTCFAFDFMSYSGTSFPSYWGGGSGIPSTGTNSSCKKCPRASATWVASMASQASILPTGSTNTWAYPFVDSDMPKEIMATTGCPYQIYPGGGSGGSASYGFNAEDIASFQ